MVMHFAYGAKRARRTSALEAARFISAPSLATTPQVGAVCTVNLGVLFGSPTITVAYQWELDGSPIGGATASSYTPTTGQDTHALRCALTPSGPGGTGSTVRTAALTVLAAAGGGGSTLTASLVASRTSGPAPLAVFFDATATISTSAGVVDPYRQVVHSFNFDDSGAGNWALDGQSKNVKVGAAVAAHVFETPGTYTVTLSSNDGHGGTDTKQVTITVTDPNTVYAGTATVVISPSGTFTGAPAGAQQLTQSTWPTISSNKRYLVRGGETMTAALGVPQGVNDSQFGSFGGGKASIDSGSGTSAGVSIYAGRPGSAGARGRLTFSDLNIRGGVDQTAFAENLLFLRVDLNRAGESELNNFAFGGALSYWACGNPGQGDSGRVVAKSSFTVVDGLFMVDCTQVGSTGNDVYPITGFYTEHCTRLAIMGCDFAKAKEHNMRMQSVNLGLVEHTAARGQSTDGIRHCIKLHSIGTANFVGNGNGPFTGRTVINFGDGPPVVYEDFWSTRYVDIRENYFGDAADNNSWCLAIRPQNANEYACELVQDVMIENNQFKQGTGSSWVAINIAARRVTCINNTRVGGGTAVTNSTTTGYSTQLLPFLELHKTDRL